MPRYMIQASYTSSAAAAFCAKPQDRVAGVRSLVEQAGGKLESLDFCLGEFDLVAISTLPDDTAAAALALAVNAAGHVARYRSQRLMSADEFMAAQKLAHGLSYQGPSKA